MDTETMIRELRNLQEKHKNDQVFTFGTRWANVCRDVADKLEELQRENAKLMYTPKGAGYFREKDSRGKIVISGKGYDVYIGEVGNFVTTECGKARIIHKFTLIEI
jgi:hypothetical protein